MKFLLTSDRENSYKELELSDTYTKNNTVKKDYISNGDIQEHNVIKSLDKIDGNIDSLTLSDVNVTGNQKNLTKEVNINFLKTYNKAISNDGYVVKSEYKKDIDKKYVIKLTDDIETVKTKVEAQKKQIKELQENQNKGDSLSSVSDGKMQLKEIETETNAEDKEETKSKTASTQGRVVKQNEFSLTSINNNQTGDINTQQYTPDVMNEISLMGNEELNTEIENTDESIIAKEQEAVNIDNETTSELKSLAANEMKANTVLQSEQFSLSSLEQESSSLSDSINGEQKVINSEKKEISKLETKLEKNKTETDKNEKKAIEAKRKSKKKGRLKKFFKHFFKVCLAATLGCIALGITLAYERRTHCRHKRNRERKEDEMQKKQKQTKKDIQSEQDNIQQTQSYINQTNTEKTNTKIISKTENNIQLQSDKMYASLLQNELNTRQNTAKVS